MPTRQQPSDPRRTNPPVEVNPRGLRPQYDRRGPQKPDPRAPLPVDFPRRPGPLAPPPPERGERPPGPPGRGDDGGGGGRRSQMQSTGDISRRDSAYGDSPVIDMAPTEVSSPETSPTYAPAPQPAAANPSAFTNTEDPYAMLRENRMFTAGRGEALNQQLEGQVGGAQSREDAYRNAAHSAYEPMLNGYSGPGYSPDEQRGILQEDGTRAAQAGQGAYNDLYLTADQQNQIMGDPYGARQFVRPDYQNSVNDSGIARQREAYGSQADAMRGAIDPTKLRVSADYGDRQDATLNGSDAGVRGAITDRLRMGDDFGGQLQGDLASGESGVRGTIDAGRLRQDAGFGDKYRMGERDVQDYQDRAARNVHNSKQAALDEIEQRAVQSGNVSPLAMGALRNRYEQGAQVNAADAQLDARLGAKSEQAKRELNIETNRQDAERGYAGLASNAEMALGGRRVDARLQGEGLRQQGERTYAGMKSDAEMQMGDRRIGEQAQREGMRLGAEQGLTDRNLATEQTIGNNRLQTETGINNSNLGLAKYQQDSGANIWQGTGQQASERAASLATNGQDVGRYAIDSRFGQGMAASTALSNRTGAMADARRQDQGEARGWLTHNQDQQNANVQKSTDQQLGLYGQTNQAMDANAGNTAQYDLGRRSQSFGTNFKSSFGKTLGWFAGGGPLAGGGGGGSQGGG